MSRVLKLSVVPVMLFLVIGILFSVSYSATPENPAKPAGAKVITSEGLLDGMKYVGSITNKADKKGGNEAIVFEKGKVISTTFSPYGFSTTAYTAEKSKDGSITFKSELNSSKPGNEKEKLKLEGTVKGNSLTGTAFWTKKDGKKAEFEIKAEKK